MLLLLALNAFAGDDALGPTALAQAGAVVADAYEPSNIAVNPGALSLSDGYRLVGWGGYGAEKEFAVGIVETNEAAALGFMLRRRVLNPPYTSSDLPAWAEGTELPPNNKQFIELQAGTSARLMEGRLGVGFGGTIAWFDTDRQQRGFSGNLDVGGAFRAQEYVTLGLVARNLLPFRSPRSQDFGGLFAIRVGGENTATLEVAGGANLTPDGWAPDLRTGFKLPLANIAELRGGYGYDGDHRVTFGAGAVNESGAFEFGMSLPLSGVTRDTLQANLGIRLDLNRVEGP